MIVLFPFQIHLVWTQSLASYFVIFKSFSISLFGRFPFWAPANFPEAICVKAKMHYMINHIWFARPSCCIKKNQKFIM